MLSSQRKVSLDPKYEVIGDLAKQALIAEVTLTPKPGLVDSQNTGSHTDLTLELMVRSAVCLAPYFSLMAEAGDQQPVSVLLREKIGALGRNAEAMMMKETSGINTHRGAIWALGLLSTAVQVSSRHPCTAEGLCVIAGELASIEDKYVLNTFSKGKRASNHYQVNGAKQQAQLGFPAITEHALPTLRLSRSLGQSETEARLNALLALTAHLTDTCVLSRSGLAGQNLLQTRSSEIIAAGGVSTDKGYAMLEQLDQEMIHLNASPGGAADLLAATLFVDWVEHSELSK